MEDNKLDSNDVDEFSDDYFEQLEEKLITEAEKSDQKEMLVSGKSVFEIDLLKRKRAKKK
ncbi:MAG: hypothetical protein NTW79_01935 [Candidatus Berkelbacteria bacterium]|nr:hypothetical protein [Candidatus Berkelbacteria bacterium]